MFGHSLIDNALVCAILCVLMPSIGLAGDADQDDEPDSIVCVANQKNCFRDVPQLDLSGFGVCILNLDVTGSPATGLANQIDMGSRRSERSN